jgi:hypothetical protein
VTTFPVSIRSAAIVLVLILLINTLVLIRSGRLNAQHAVSWVIAELVLLVLLAFDPVGQTIVQVIGEANLLPAVVLVVFVWIVVLMLDILIRVNEVAVKLNGVNQELGLLRERVDCLEAGMPRTEIAKGEMGESTSDGSSL